MVRTLEVFARGRRRETSARGSITTHPAPYRFSSAAAASPAGPPPATSTAIFSMLTADIFTRRKPRVDVRQRLLPGLQFEHVGALAAALVAQQRPPWWPPPARR